MRFIISFTIFSVVTDICWTEIEKEIQGNSSPKSVLKLLRDFTERESNDISNSQLHALWNSKPVPQIPQVDIMDIPRRVRFRQPFSMTKLAKSVTSSFDPYFRKDNFEPFERRPKPITLVAFRNTGVFSRQPSPSLNAFSSEVAELQSPFNEVSSFWKDSPYVS